MGNLLPTIANPAVAVTLRVLASVGVPAAWAVVVEMILYLTRRRGARS